MIWLWNSILITVIFENGLCLWLITITICKTIIMHANSMCWSKFLFDYSTQL